MWLCLCTFIIFLPYVWFYNLKLINNYFIKFKQRKSRPWGCLELPWHAGAPLLLEKFMEQIFKTMIILLSTWLKLYQEYVERLWQHCHLLLSNVTFKFQNFPVAGRTREFSRTQFKDSGRKGNWVYSKTSISCMTPVHFTSNQEYHSYNLP